MLLQKLASPPPFKPFEVNGITTIRDAACSLLNSGSQAAIGMTLGSLSMLLRIAASVALIITGISVPLTASTRHR